MNSALASASVPASSARPRVEGVITEDGRVLCACGKRCGGVEEGKVTFSCQCGALVTLDSDIIFMRICEKSIDRIHSIIETMASKKRSAA